MTKVKTRKPITNSKEGWAKFGTGHYFKIKTVGFHSNKMTIAEQKFSETFKMPSKSRPLQAHEVAEYEKLTGSKLGKVIIEIDGTTLAYKEYVTKNMLFNIVLKLAVNIEGTYKNEEEEYDLWEAWGLSKGDYYGLTLHLIDEDGMAMAEQDLEIVISEIEKIRSGIPTYAQAEIDLIELKEKSPELFEEEIEVVE